MCKGQSHPLDLVSVLLFPYILFPNEVSTLLRVKCDTLPLRTVLKQNNLRIQCDNKNQPCVLYFRYKGTFSDKKRLHALTLVARIRENPTLVPLAVKFRRITQPRFANPKKKMVFGYYSGTNAEPNRGL